MRADQFTDALAHHGEGPIWDDRCDSIAWVDIFRGDVLVTTLDASTTRHHVDDVAACVVPRDRGGYVVATARGFAAIDGDVVEPLGDNAWQDATVRMNDGACDANGRFFCGSMAYDAAPNRGALYRLNTDLTIDEVFNEVTISNGIGWAPDQSRAYYVDSATNRIDMCSPDLLARECFVEVDPELGEPDGLTVDAEGGVWVALWGGSQVRRYGPDGNLEAVVEVPVRQPSSCVFGGSDLATLFISTSAQGLVEPEANAGALFAVSPGVAGQPTARFRG